MAEDNMGITPPASGKEDLWDDEKQTLAPDAGASPAPSGELDDKGLPKDHRQRSDLGRRLSTWEERLAGMESRFSRMDTLLDRLETQQFQPPPSSAPQDDEKPPVDYITTPEDFEKYQNWRNQKQQIKMQQYGNAYLGTVERFSSSTDAQLHAEIKKELLDNRDSYLTHSNHRDPVHDATINYQIARGNVLNRRYQSSPKANVRGATNNPPTGFGSPGGGTPPPAQKVTEIDPYAKKFIDAVGANEDDQWVQDSLKKAK